MGNEKLKKVSEALEEHIEMLIRKRASMSPPDIELLNKDLCALETIKRIESAGEGGESSYSMNAYDDGGSYRRGRAANGRFTSRDGSGSYDGGGSSGGNSSRYYDGSGNSGYSGHSKRDRMIDHLEQLIDVAQNDEQRAFLQNWLDRVNNTR